MMERVDAIVHGPGTLKEKIEAYHRLKETQTLFKRLPKDMKNDEVLFDRMCLAVMDDCLARPAEEMPRFQGAYKAAIDDALQRFRDRWNEISTNHIGEYICYHFPHYYAKKIRNRYKELHPDLVEEDALLRSLAVLKAAGITNAELEKRCDEVTHHYDIEIIANLPIVEEIIAKSRI